VTERLMPSDPPTDEEVAAATRMVDDALDTLPSYGVHADDAATLVGVAGTVTTIASLLLGLTTYERDRVHHATFAAAEVHAMAARLLAMRAAEREAAGVPRGRSDVIGAGALILGRVLHRAATERLTISDADILDGIAWSTA
jgi:exopolyphosphatase / guanosine-5'-triphosphate,3'-diphosphate pyrophosphatase